MKIGVIGLKNKWSTEKLAESLEKRTGFNMVIELDKISFDVAAGKAYYNGTDLASLDGLVIKKLGENYSPTLLDRLDILQYLHETDQVRVFSNPKSILRIVNRLGCTTLLRQGNIPLPDTTITENFDEAFETVKKYQKCVFKPLYTSKSRGMKVVHADEDVRAAVADYREAGNQVFYIQKFMNHPGKDLGVCFIGNKYIGTYARVGKEGAWNTTTHLGGKYESYEPDESVIVMAQKAQSLVPLDFTCVDVVESDEGPKVFEISAFGGVKGLKEAANIDLTEMFSDYIVEQFKA